MDAREPRSYVPATMNLLLLLSALLSALTGVAGGARAVEPQAVAERVVARPLGASVAAATRRPANAVVGLTVAGWTRIVVPPQPVASAPLYQQRRRE